MIDERKHRIHGESVRDWIRYLPVELDDIGIGLHAIVQTGRYDFELADSELTEFIRRSIGALVQKGARPEHLSSRSHFDRRVKLHYGSDTTEEIVEGVIADWIASGAKDLEWGDFWFALPGTFNE